MPPPLDVFDIDDLDVLGVPPVFPTDVLVLAAGAKLLIDPGLVRGLFTFAGGGTYDRPVFVFVVVFVIVRGAEWRGGGGGERTMGDDVEDGGSDRVVEERAGVPVEEFEADAARGNGRRRRKRRINNERLIPHLRSHRRRRRRRIPRWRRHRSQNLRGRRPLMGLLLLLVVVRRPILGGGGDLDGPPTAFIPPLDGSMDASHSPPHP